MGEAFQFQRQFRELIPEITQQSVSTILRDSSLQKIPKILQRKKVSGVGRQSFERKSTLMTQFSTNRYLFYAFCLVQNSVMSTLTIHMISKRDTHRSAVKQLKSIYLQINTLKFAVNHFGMLTLLAGSACGRLIIYHDFETGEPIVESLRFSSHAVVDMVVPTFNSLVFALTANGTIYAIDYRQKLIVYQYQCEIPQIEDRQLFLLMDQAESLIGCVFSYGRIIIWQINANLRRHLQPSWQADCEILGDSSSGDRSLREKRLIKKQGKQKLTRNLVFKPQMNILNCIGQGIKWISFFGTFLGVVTKQNLFRLIAVNINSNGQNNQLFFIISQIPLLGQTSTQATSQQIAHIQNCGTGFIVVINCYAKNQSQLFSSRIEKYNVSECWKKIKLQILECQSDNPIEQVCWDASGRFVLCRESQGYSLVQLKEIEV